MDIYEEIESVIKDLPTEQKLSIKILLNQIETVRRDKKVRAFGNALQARFEFESTDGDPSLN